MFEIPTSEVECDLQDTQSAVKVEEMNTWSLCAIESFESSDQNKEYIDNYIWTSPIINRKII